MFRVLKSQEGIYLITSLPESRRIQLEKRYASHNFIHLPQEGILISFKVENKSLHSMIDFNHVLVPFDGSESAFVALKNALYLSEIFNSKVTAVYVKKSDGDSEYLRLAEEIKTVEKERKKDITFLHPTGKMYKEVVKTVEQVGADVIIMGTHGVSGFEEFWIGSDAYRVVSSSPVPVITMQESFDGVGFRKLIVPIDQSKETRQKIPMVAQLAKMFNSQIHLLGTTKYTDDESQSKVRVYIKQSLDILDKEGLSATVSYVIGQNIAKATIDCAKEMKGDLVLMMSESEPSSGLFMGSNAQQVVNHSSVPVLTLHPIDVGIAISGY